MIGEDFRASCGDSSSPTNRGDLTLRGLRLGAAGALTVFECPSMIEKNKASNMEIRFD